MHGVSNFLRNTIEDNIDLRIQSYLNQNKIEEYLKKELEKLREKKEKGVTSINKKDDFRRNLDVTSTVTSEEQSEFSKRFEKKDNSVEKPHSLPMDLIQ